VDDYTYDIFVSYRHEAPALDWLRLHFYPMLERWLRSAMGREPAIFVDWNIETGVVWPDALRDGRRKVLRLWRNMRRTHRWYPAGPRSSGEPFRRDASAPSLWSGAAARRRCRRRAHLSV
jgi:hypothetical protein